jgi:hypothetical protein
MHGIKQLRGDFRRELFGQLRADGHFTDASLAQAVAQFPQENLATRGGQELGIDSAKTRLAEPNLRQVGGAS